MRGKLVILAINVARTYLAQCS